MNAFCVLLALAAAPGRRPARQGGQPRCLLRRRIRLRLRRARRQVHAYDTTTASGRFFRARRSGGKWEELPGGPRVQGVALVAARADVLRVGGMQPRNKPGEPSDLLSLKSAARYDHGFAKKWASPARHAVAAARPTTRR